MSSIAAPREGHLVGRAGIPPVAQGSRQRTSGSGLWLFLLVASIAASGSADLRIAVGGLWVPPFALLLVPAVFFVLLPRLAWIPARLLAAVAVFGGTYLVASLRGPHGGAEIVKVATTLALLLTTIASVQSERDERLAVFALAAVGFFFSLEGLMGVGHAGPSINPLEEVANKNAFSLYVLPGALLGAELLLRAPPRRWFGRVFLLASLVTIGAAIFSSANRSGWLGAIVIAVLLLLRGRSVRTGLAIVSLGLGAYMILDHYGHKEVTEERWEQTVRGYHSDELRWELFVESARIFRRHPILGVSPGALPELLARRLDFDLPEVDPHNVLGLFMGGGGLLVLTGFAWLAFVLWRRPEGELDRRARLAHGALRMALVLWFVRGMFTREILYSPTFTLAIALPLARLSMLRRHGGGREP